MVSIDVVCEAENLPRIRLLQTHLQNLQVDLTLHAELPEEPSARILYVPKRQASRLAHVPASQKHERIALYLDADCEAIDADLEVHLHSWPARSSDKDVYRLAAHLKRPFSGTASSAAPSTATNTTSDRRALWGLGALVVLLFGAIFLETQRQPAEDDIDNLTRDTETPTTMTQHTEQRGDDATPQEDYNQGAAELSTAVTESNQPNGPNESRTANPGAPDMEGSASPVESTDLYCRDIQLSYAEEQLRWYSGVASKACRPVAQNAI